MALIKCSNCGKEISDKADCCIKCGEPVHKEIEKINDLNIEDDYHDIFIKLFFIFILAIIVMIGSIFMVKGV